MNLVDLWRYANGLFDVGETVYGKYSGRRGTIAEPTNGSMAYVKFDNNPKWTEMVDCHSLSYIKPSDVKIAQNSKKHLSEYTFSGEITFSTGYNTHRSKGDFSLFRPDLVC